MLAYPLNVRRIQLHIEEELDEKLAAQALERKVFEGGFDPVVPLAAHRRRRKEEDRRPHRAGARHIVEGDPDDSTSVNDVVYGR